MVSDRVSLEVFMIPLVGSLFMAKPICHSDIVNEL